MKDRIRQISLAMDLAEQSWAENDPDKCESHLQVVKKISEELRDEMAEVDRAEVDRFAPAFKKRIDRMLEKVNQAQSPV